MLQTLWFFIKVAVVTVTCVWLAAQPGYISMSLAEYDISIRVGVFFLIMAVAIFITMSLLRLVRGLFSMPKAIAKYYEADQRKKSFRALTRGLVAVAAGDSKMATKYSKQTKALWPDMRGLPLLLEAQAAKLRGEEGLAQNRFEHLMKEKDAVFLGIRGLLKSALDENDFERALDFARQAEKNHPKKTWVVKTVYNLEIKNRLWGDALRTNNKLLKLEAKTPEKIKNDRVVIHLLQYRKAKEKGESKRADIELDMAYKLDPYFVPAAIYRAENYIIHKKRKKAAQVIEKAWRMTPHPQLVELWDSLSPVLSGKNREKDQAKISAWYEKLISLNADHVEGYIAAARAAMNIELWGEAKSYLAMAEKIYPSARVFRLQAIVEQKSTHNEDAIHRLMERAAEAVPEKVWVCSESGKFYEEWHPIAKPHGSFNSIIWDFAGARLIQNSNNNLAANEEMMLLDVPA